MRLATVASAPDAPVAAGATTLDGKWRADRASLSAYPGGFDGFFHADLVWNIRNSLIVRPRNVPSELLYSPHEEMVRHNCDPEAAAGFLRQ